jgi:nitric-oxide synthase
MPISSATPGTTLRVIGVDCFDGSSQLFDTPGVHLYHRLSAQLLPAELKAILPRGRMKPYTPPPADGSLAGQTLFWGGLGRIDVLEAPPSIRLTFATAYGLRVSDAVPTAGADALYAAEVGRSLTPPLDLDSAAQLGGLELRREVEVELDEMAQACDISISGLGWVSVGALASLRKTGSMHARLAVWAPKGVEVSVRQPMPITGLPNQVDLDVD